MANIIVKNYEHINRSMPNWNTPKGVYVKNKDHYDQLMKKNNMITHEEMMRRSENKNIKEYKVSKDTLAIIESAKASKDRRGNVKLSDRAIDAMIKKGAIGKKIPNYMKLPKNIRQGGFE